MLSYESCVLTLLCQHDFLRMNNGADMTKGAYFKSTGDTLIYHLPRVFQNSAALCTKQVMQGSGVRKNKCPSFCKVHKMIRGLYHERSNYRDIRTHYLPSSLPDHWMGRVLFPLKRTFLRHYCGETSFAKQTDVHHDDLTQVFRGLY